MKLWISDTKTQTHRLVKLHAEEHSGYEYLGDLKEEDIKAFLVSLQETDVDKNLKLLQYYGYLNLFIKGV
jgi:hypothetical protein